MRECPSGSVGTVTYLLGDHLGSTSVALSDAGGIVGEQKYYAYGRPRGTETVPTDKLFTGHQKEGDLYFMQARFYDTVTGRFLSADSIVPNPANPQSLNRYSYVYNNPLAYTDPTGHCSDFSCPDIVMLGELARAYECAIYGCTPPPSGEDTGCGSDWYCWKLNEQAHRDWADKYVSQAPGPKALVKLAPFMPITGDWIEFCSAFSGNTYCFFPGGESVSNLDRLLSAGSLGAWFLPSGAGRLTRAGQAAHLADEIIEEHHLLPVAEEFQQHWARAGLDPEDYTVPMKQSEHRLKVGNGLHTGPAGVNWNSQWREFFRQNPNAGQVEILAQLDLMVQQAQVPIVWPR